MVDMEAIRKRDAMLLAKANDLPLITSDDEEADSDNPSSSESSDDAEEPLQTADRATTGGTTPAKAAVPKGAPKAPRKARGPKLKPKMRLPAPAVNRGDWVRSGNTFRALVEEVPDIDLKVLTECTVHELCDRHGGNARYSIIMKYPGMRTAAPTINIRQPKAHFSYVMTDYDLAPLMHDLETAYVRSLKRRHGSRGGDNRAAPATKRARTSSSSGS